MKKRLPLILGIIVLCIAFAVIGNMLPEPEPTPPPPPTNTPPPTPTPPPTLTPAETYLDQYGGMLEVYQRILTLTDCTALQNEFDQADKNLKLQQPGTEQYQWGIGYMNAADQRMKDIGCY